MALWVTCYVKNFSHAVVHRAFTDEGILKTETEPGKQQKPSDLKGQAGVNTIVGFHKQNDCALRENVTKY
jgi:hypothetical protein